ncbi:MAG: hypothetical protein JWM74_2308 [Myxococcaceae bacterium]|nr:hypothetical protein [Myxococcaceae bacterium]
MGHYFRPKMACRITVPVFGGGPNETVTIPLRLRRATLDHNDHNHADTLVVAAEWRDCGVDPRLIKNATTEFWMGNGNERGVFTPSLETLRFLGVMNKPRRVAKEGGGFQVELEFHDYTAFFLEQKPFPSAGVPAYTDTLADAWAQVCDHTGPLGEDGKIQSSVAILRDALECRGGVSPDLVLGTAVAQRFARLSKVPVKPQSDAWAVWQQCVGMMGLISWIDGDRCVVTTSTEYYTVDTAPRLIWGRNILDAEEQAHAKFSDKGVALTSFDPISGTTYEAFYPPPGDARIVRKRVTAKKAGKHGRPSKAKAPAFPSERYDFFEYHGVTDLDRLHEIATRVWDERSRQELDGKIRTGEMFVDGVDGNLIDLLELRAGDAVRIEIDAHDKERLAALSGSESQAREYLAARGYSPEAATLILANMSKVGKLDTTFHATNVRTTLEASGDGGHFEVEVSYHNKIRIE